MSFDILVVDVFLSFGNIWLFILKKKKKIVGGKIVTVKYEFDIISDQTYKVFWWNVLL